MWKVKMKSETLFIFTTYDELFQFRNRSFMAESETKEFVEWLRMPVNI